MALEPLLRGEQAAHQGEALRANEAAASVGRPAPHIVAGMLVYVTGNAGAARQRVAERFGNSGTLPSYRLLMAIEGVTGGADLLLAGDAAEVTAGRQAYLAAGATEFIAFPTGREEERPRREALLSGLALEDAPGRVPAR